VAALPDAPPQLHTLLQPAAHGLDDVTADGHWSAGRGAELRLDIARPKPRARRRLTGDKRIAAVPPCEAAVPGASSRRA
jgi:hypothetical protein